MRTVNGLKKILLAATGREIHIDVPLSNLAIDYQPEGMIAEFLCPIVPVPNITGSFPIFSRADLLRTENDHRAPGTAARKVHRNVSSDSFLCRNYALATDITMEDRSNADPIYVQKLFNGAAEFLKTKLYINWEVRVASQVTSTSNVGSSAAVSSSWTGTEVANALQDVNTAIDVVKDRTGKRPNQVTFGEKAWRYFRRNIFVRNLIFGANNGGGYPSREQVANLLEVERILVGDAYQNTGKELLAESLSQVWGDKVLVSYQPSAPSIMTPSFMYAFRWTANGVPNMQVERHPYDTRRKTEDIELGYFQDEKITGQEYSFLLVAVTSST